MFPSRLLRRLVPHADRLVALALGLIALGVYARTCAPSLLEIGDVNELATVSYILGIAHPTGYPLFTLLGHLFTRLPWGEFRDVAGQVNLMAALLAAGAVPAVYLLTRELGASKMAAVAAAGLFAFGQAFWSTGIRADVHGLNALFVALSTWLLVWWGRDLRAGGGDGEQNWRPAQRHLIACAFVCGLSLTNHITTYLLAPGFVVYLIVVGRPFWRHPSRLVLPVLAFALPLLIYLYIPIRGSQLMADASLAADPAGIGVPLRISLGYVSPHYRSGGWLGFANTVFALDFMPGLAGVPWAEAPARLATVPPIVLRQMGAGGVILAAFGFVLVARRRPREALLTGVVWLTMIAQVTRYDEPDVPVFLIPAYVMMAAWAGLGIQGIVRAVTALSPRRLADIASAVLSAAFLALPVAMLMGNYAALDFSRDWAVRRFTDDVLAQRLPPGAVILAGDEAAALRFRQIVEGQRRDLVAVQSGFGTPRFYDIIERGRLKRWPVYLSHPFPPEERDAAPTRYPRKLVAVPHYGERPPEFAAYTNIANQVAFLGYDLRPDRLRAGRALHLKLYWRALQDLDTDYDFLVRLISGGRIAASIERPPIGPWFGTSHWRAGQVFVEEVHMLLPANTQPGTYNLETAFTRSHDLLPLIRDGGVVETAPIVLRYMEVEP